MSVGFSSDENEVDLEGLRIRLRNMSDQELQRFGQAREIHVSAGGESRRAAPSDVNH